MPRPKLPPEERKPSKTTSVSVTPHALFLWKKLAGHLGTSQTAVLETLIREAAKREGVYEALPNGDQKSA